MIDKRSVYDRCVADLEMAQMAFDRMVEGRDASETQLRKAAVHAKKLEFKLAAAKLAQAEYHLDALKTRLDFLEARCAREEGGTKREQAELAWARGAAPVNSATVTRLKAELEVCKRELEALLTDSEAGDGAQTL